MTTTQALDPKLIARIKKLHNMAEGARAVGSLAEADAFLAAVKKTLMTHNLDMSVLDVDLHDLADPLGRATVEGTTSRHKDKVVAWVLELADNVADAHYCAMNHSLISSRVWFYGRATNRTTCVAMYTYLRDMAERLSWDAYYPEAKRRRDTYGTEKGLGQWRLSWLTGFAEEVGRRYRAMRVRLEANTGMQLVLTGVQKEARALADTKLTLDKDVNPVDARQLDWVALEDGRAAARTANLQPNTLADDARGAPRQLKETT